MRPGSLLIRLVLALAVASLLVPFVREAVWIVTAGLAATFAAAVFEAVELRRVGVTVDRPDKVVLYLDETDSVEVRLGTTADRPLHLEVRQVWPVAVEPAAAREAGLCRPGELVSFSFPLRAISRGTARVEPLWASLTRWRLVERITAAGGETEISIIPNLKAVGRLHRQLNQFVLRGMGTRTAPRFGKGREFDRMRDYVRGDEYRDIAWKASARHGRLIVREFRVERSQDIVLCLDLGHRMAERIEHVSRLDHAINAATLLSYVCNRMEDRVGVVSFAGTVDQSIAPSRGATHLRQTTAFMAGLQPVYRHSDYLMLAADLRRRLRNRTLVVLMTMLPNVEEGEEMLKAVAMLGRRHLPLVIVQFDPALRAAAETLPADETELARVIVARELRHERERLVRELRARGAMVVDTRPGSIAIDSFNAYLEVKRRQML